MKHRPPIEIERVQVDGRWVLEWSCGDLGGYVDKYEDAVNNALICTGDKHLPREQPWRFIRWWRLTLSLARGAIRWHITPGQIGLTSRSGCVYDFQLKRHGAFLKRRIHLPNLLT